MVIFVDGICPKCGGPTHGYGGPMKCSRCGHESEFIIPESLKRILEKEDNADALDTPCNSQISRPSIGQAQPAQVG
ncbi:Hypothetical protein DPCES_2275 [Desulfitobacterium hafniense]|uniref:Uncharacterized protein n=1 Tax=Desulfitobacterium hafniense TaxID=49338 RepID=A0A098B1D3_DESHA|nr:Hypothetical protein DPCES_2275 [Desulfitobacterium hafniense]